jgi:hypothetical protein
MQTCRGPGFGRPKTASARSARGFGRVQTAPLGAELIRIIRQISQAKERVSTIEKELAALRQSEIALLKKDAEERAEEGRDLLAELAASVKDQIEKATMEYEALTGRDRTA